MHLEPNQLALLAIGDGDDDSRNHVHTCSVCRAEVSSLSAVSAILADGGPVPVRAPEHVWTAIAAAIDGQGDPVAPAPVNHLGRDPEGSRSLEASGTHHARHRRFSGRWLWGAAAAGAAAMWVGSMVIDAVQQPGDELIASARLAPIAESVEPGEAEMYERDGQRVLRVDTAALPDVTDGYLEVWLLGDDPSGMVTIGTLNSGEAEFVLPEGLPTDTYPVVDVSVEHYDGDPTHSGESLWRGPLASS